MANLRTVRSADEAAGSLERKVARRLDEQVRRGQTVTVALSGGVDSIVLLDLTRSACESRGFRLRALHVNHGLSPHAHAWERFCREHCRRRRIPFQAVRVSVAGAGSNVEAEARAARYRAFVEHGSEIVALAHNQNDQAETVLLRLLRGAGVRGLAAMPAARNLGAVPGRTSANAARLIRPLLGVARSEIEAHALRRRLRWIDDESNADQRFDRNFLRERIMPLLEARFAGCRECLVRTADHLSEAAGLLDRLAAADCTAVCDGNRLRVSELRSLGDARAANALRYFLASRGEPALSTARTREMLHQLGTERRDAQPTVALSTGSLKRFRGWIELVPARQLDAQTTHRLWHGEACVTLGGGGELQVLAVCGEGISAQRLKAGRVSIRSRRGGERMRLDSRGPTRTLKNLLQEACIAPWRRSRMPLVFCDERLVWAPHIGVASEFRAEPREPALTFVWREPCEVG